ncbi:hypothetical protein B9R80_002426 [Salmonella enterica]|nr:hypothetical protein [Salmonella enterica]
MSNKFKRIAAQILCLVLAGFFVVAGVPLLAGFFLLASMFPIFRFLIMGPTKQ